MTGEPEQIGPGQSQSQDGLLYYSACVTTLELPGDAMLEQNVCPHPMGVPGGQQAPDKKITGKKS